MNQLSTTNRPEIEPVLRRAFMAPVIAEWARQLGKTLIVSTTEDDDTAAANCAVEAVMAVDGVVRGKVTYTLAAQTVIAIATGNKPASGDGPEEDPIPAIDAFFKLVAAKARELLNASGLTCTVSLARVRDVRGASYFSPVSSRYTVHMVTQPTHKDAASPEPVSLWFELETTPGAVAAPRAIDTAQAPAANPVNYREAASVVAEPKHPTPAPVPPRASEARPDPAAAQPPGIGAGQRGGTDQSAAYQPVLRTGRLEIVDQNGVPRAVVSTLADGSPHIVFADRDGRIRAAISLAKDGQPRILFLDELGRRVLDLPHAGSSQNANQPPARRPAQPQQPSGQRPGPVSPPRPPANRRPDSQTPPRRP